MLTASQVGVRLTRRLLGAQSLLREDWSAGRVHDTEVGVSPSLAPKWDSVSVPYGSLLPGDTRGLIVAGGISRAMPRRRPSCGRSRSAG